MRTCCSMFASLASLWERIASLGVDSLEAHERSTGEERRLRLTNQSAVIGAVSCASFAVAYALAGPTFFVPMIANANSARMPAPRDEVAGSGEALVDMPGMPCCACTAGGGDVAATGSGASAEPSRISSVPNAKAARPAPSGPAPDGDSRIPA